MSSLSISAVFGVFSFGRLAVSVLSVPGTAHAQGRRVQPASACPAAELLV